MISLRHIATACYLLLVSATHASDLDSFGADSKTGCKVFKANMRPADAVTWNGNCVLGFADGEGTAQWYRDGKPDVRFEGAFRAEGKQVVVAAIPRDRFTRKLPRAIGKP